MRKTVRVREPSCKLGLGIRAVMCGDEIALHMKLTFHCHASTTHPIVCFTHGFALRKAKWTGEHAFGKASTCKG